MRRWSIALFRVCGIQLEVHGTFLLLLAYVGFIEWQAKHELLGLFWALFSVLCIFTCVVLHELGHSLVAMRFGIRVPRILLLPIGGMAQFDSIPRQPGRELAIAIAGPAVNYVLAAVLITIFGVPRFPEALGIPDQLAEIPASLIGANIVLGLFNLIPAFPMDGGRMLRAVFATQMPYLKATHLAARIGQGIAVLGGVLLLLSGATLGFLPVLCVFIIYGAEMEYQYTRRMELFAGLTIGDVTRQDYVALPSAATIGAALERLRHTRPQDLLLLEDGRPVAILSRHRLAQAIREHRQAEPAADHALPRFRELQADGPLELPLAPGGDSRQTLFPVYSLGQFIGVVDLDHLEESARLARQLGRVS